MLAYYFKLAIRSFKRNRILTALMVLAIALGIGATMTTLTVYHVLSGDPIPQKSGKLFYPRLDPRPLPKNKADDSDPEPPEQMTRYDAEALLHEHRGDRQAMMTSGVPVVEHPRTHRKLVPQGRYTSADFFPMFDAPFRFGGPWGAVDDVAKAQVVVLSDAFNNKYFGGENSVGRELAIGDAPFRVIGVLKPWALQPKFFDMTSDRYGDMEDLYLPISTALDRKLDTQGSMNCWDDFGADDSRGLNVPCGWLQYWVELDSPQKVAAYREYLDNYSRVQKQSGRYQRAPNTRLHGVMEWLEVRKAVPSDVRLQMWLAFGFLAVCLLNTIGLLLAKFLRRSGEYGVRRALGASRRAIFLQCLVEASIVGFVGGVIGVLLAAFGTWLVRQQPDSYAQLVRLDLPMLLLAFVLAFAASLLSGALPAWRASRVAPAIQLKSQ
ncbi:ABC transporter permease [Solilutibacter silvestris]|uniref:MacB-like periplasmic core domain-containing protein n=1 Tax=Solilutibacter silvestris TaxID=1645665 RepID=A0A2K1Q1V4_9GAMM|nr:ABC transporter permease [Lysobacter silvestris]PNS09013.1 MacB-like periplasmic core domain-containing protein [Lysobacter silvestris]